MRARTENPPISFTEMGHEFRRISSILSLFLLIAAFSGPSTASDEAETIASEPETERQETVPPPSDPIPPKESKLRIFGHLTQAWAKSRYARGGFRPAAQSEVILGVPPDGTTDYRTLALMFRYEMTDLDHLTVQLSHRALGDSPVDDVEDEIVLDWAYFEHRFGTETRLRVGRFPSPNGLLNEVRDVGMVLPFFRTPFVFYGEGNYTTETVDGLLLRHTLALPTRWQLELNAFAGEWDVIEFAPPGTPGTEPAGIARAREALGLTLMFASPDEDFHIGAGGEWYDVEGGIIRNPGETTPWWDYHASMEILRGKLLIRAEARWNRFVSTNVFPGGVKADSIIAYLTIGYRLNDRWSVYLQREENPARWRSPFLAAPFRNMLWEDTAFAVNRWFSSNFVAKAEFHVISWEDFDFVGFEITPAGPRAIVETRRASGGRQVILSLSTGF